MQISDISKGKISLAASLSSRKIRVKEGLFVAEGRKCVNDTIDHFEPEYVAALPSWLESNSGLAERYAGRVYRASEHDLKKMSSLSTPPEVIAVYRMPESEPIDSLLETPLPDDLYLMLDSIQDPGNLGTILRAAHWFGVKRIFASPMTADVYGPKTVQASMGAVAAVRMDYVDLCLLAERHSHIPMVGLELNGQDIYTAQLPESAFIVMGNEGNGLSPGMRSSINLGLTIPPYDASSHPESLNVAVATAITLSCFRHSR